MLHDIRGPLVLVIDLAHILAYGVKSIEPETRRMINWIAADTYVQ